MLSKFQQHSKPYKKRIISDYKPKIVPNDKQELLIKASSSSWYCPYCTLENGPNVEKCDACQSLKLDDLKIDYDSQTKTERKNNNKLKTWICDAVQLSEYYDIFSAQGFDDMSTLCYLDENGLITMGVKKMAHRLKILHEIEIIKNEMNKSKEMNLANSIIENVLGDNNQKRINSNGDSSKTEEVYILKQLENDNYNNQNAYFE
eukprot:56258_1